MSKIAVLTDSCASIPKNLIDELNIHIVSYYIHRGSEVLRDLVTIQRDEFLNWLPTATTLPTTACPGPGDYLKKFNELISNGVKNIISIHMTSKGSGAFDAATLAKNMLKDDQADIRIEVIDTHNVSLCQGWMAIESARSAIRGANLDEILARIKRMIPVTQMIQTADTLKYLQMGGRIGMAKRLVGSMLNIKPLIGMRDGQIVALGQTRSRLKAYRAMSDYVAESVGNGKVKIAYVHAGALNEIERLKTYVEEKVNIAESFITELSPALAVHTGPGTAGLCFFPVDLLGSG